MHGAAEGLEVVAAVAELADVAMTAFDHRRESSSTLKEIEREREHEVAVEEELRAENVRLRSVLDMYREALHDFKSTGLLEHMQQLDGMNPDELCCRLKERVDSPEFLQKLAANTDSSSWVMVKENSTTDLDSEDYVVITKDDIVDGIACFMAKYLSDVPKAKDMTPEELQKVLSKAFVNQDKKGLWKMLWGASKVAYTIASWTATAVGIYKNPMLIRTALVTIWTISSVLRRMIM